MNVHWSLSSFAFLLFWTTSSSQLSLYNYSQTIQYCVSVLEWDKSHSQSCAFIRLWTCMQRAVDEWGSRLFEVCCVQMQSLQSYVTASTLSRTFTDISKSHNQPRCFRQTYYLNECHIFHAMDSPIWLFTWTICIDLSISPAASALKTWWSTPSLSGD